VKCEDFMKLIDAYIDDELDKAQASEMIAHAQECEKCDREMKLAEMLKATMRGMDDEIVPPLAAQAAWRGAIKAESRKNRIKRIYKYCGTVAAALVVLVGCVTLMKPFGGNEKGDDIATANSDSGFTFVATDGDEAAPTAMARTLAMGDEAAYGGTTASIKLCCDAPASACETIIGLAGEYGGTSDTPSTGENSAYVTVYIPSGSIDSFIEALGIAGEITDSVIEGDGDTITVGITIKTAE